MPIIGYLYYLLSFFCFITSFFIAFTRFHDASIFSQIEVIYYGFCALWIGWWFKRAICAHFGIFFSNEFEFENMSDFFYKMTNGKSHNFLWQLVIFFSVGYLIITIK